jgi:hypothetical protein
MRRDVAKLRQQISGAKGVDFGSLPSSSLARECKDGHNPARSPTVQRLSSPAFERKRTTGAVSNEVTPTDNRPYRECISQTSSFENLRSPHTSPVITTLPPPLALPDENCEYPLYSFAQQSTDLSLAHRFPPPPRALSPNKSRRGFSSPTPHHSGPQRQHISQVFDKDMPDLLSHTSSSESFPSPAIRHLSSPRHTSMPPPLVIPLEGKPETPQISPLSSAQNQTPNLNKMRQEVTKLRQQISGAQGVCIPDPKDYSLTSSSESSMSSSPRISSPIINRCLSPTRTMTLTLDDDNKSRAQVRKSTTTPSLEKMRSKGEVTKLRQQISGAQGFSFPHDEQKVPTDPPDK